MMHDDLEPCPEGIDVAFRYDYNLEHTDLFGRQVKAVTLYVFDPQGRYLTQKEESGAALAAAGYVMHMPLAPGSYQFVAVASDDTYNSILSGAGAKIRRASLASGSTIHDLQLVIERNGGNVEQGTHPLRPTWQSMYPVSAQVIDMEPAFTTIPMMRLTNTLHITLRQKDIPTEIDTEDFDISLCASNGAIRHDNSMASEEAVTYSPYKRSNISTPDDNGYARALADINFLRLIHQDEATLAVVDHETGFVNSLPIGRALAQMRQGYPTRNYSEQEFLDRCHEFELDLMMEGDRLKYATLRISVLAWSKRIQEVDFGNY